MKKFLAAVVFLILNNSCLYGESNIVPIMDGNPDSKVHLIIYESLTCGHCADFHKNIYPSLKKDFISKGLVKIEFRSFPLDLAAFNASKIAHCKNDGDSRGMVKKEQNNSKSPQRYVQLSKFCY